MSLQRIFNAIDNDDFFRFPLLGREFDSVYDVSKPLFASNVGAVNIKETDTEFEFDFQAPGFTKDELTIDLQDNILQVKGEHKQEKIEEDKEKKYHRKEVSHSSFSRSFTLPNNVDSTKVGASLENGILQVKVAKTPEEKPESKRIQIQ